MRQRSESTGFFLINEDCAEIVTESIFLARRKRIGDKSARSVSLHELRITRRINDDILRAISDRTGDIIDRRIADALQFAANAEKRTIVVILNIRIRRKFSDDLADIIRINLIHLIRENLRIRDLLELDIELASCLEIRRGNVSFHADIATENDGIVCCRDMERFSSRELAIDTFVRVSASENTVLRVRILND